jgi:hypothetical protein
MATFEKTILRDLSYAVCRDCLDWWREEPDALALGHAHAAEFGHRVDVVHLVTAQFAEVVGG